MAIATEIIEQFYLQVDDQSELSSTEEFALLNRVLRRIYRMRSWVWLIKAASVSVSGSTASLPSDYQYVLESFDDDMGAPGAYVHVTNNSGSSYSRVRVIPMNQRRQYTNNQSVCYIDLVNKNVVFMTSDYDGMTAEFDYVYLPVDVTGSDTPVVPDTDALPHLMAVEFDVMQQGEKGLSWSSENQALYESHLADMIYQNDLHLTYGSRI